MAKWTDKKYVAAYMREWRKKNYQKDKIIQKNSFRRRQNGFKNRERETRKNMKRLYGISWAFIKAEKLKGCCVCGGFERLQVDHCHETDQYRGVLCGYCNTALAFMKEDVVLMQKLIEYVNGVCVPLKLIKNSS